MSIIIIEINNNKCKLEGPLKILNKLDKMFCIKHPQAFFVRQHARDGWDGQIHYITDRGYFKTGLLPQIVKAIEELDHEVNLIKFNYHPLEFKIPKQIGELRLRDYQIEGVRSVLMNKIGNMPFQRGILDMATNAGKTLLMACLYLATGKPTLILLNSKDLYNQFLVELPPLVGDDFGNVQGKTHNWGGCTVAMVQTVSQNKHAFKRELQKFEVLLVDEGDQADNKTYKGVLEYCFNAVVRVTLSGSILMGKLKKHESRNQNIKTWFGDRLYKISKREMVDKGFSTELTIKIIPCNFGEQVPGNWMEEYRRNISTNTQRHELSLKRIEFNLKYGRDKILVMCRFHEHVEELYHYLGANLEGDYSIDYVHHEIKNRKDIIQDFRVGKLDILVSSLITKRGQNFPLLRYILNASAGDSAETVSQIMGRGERTHESKSMVYVEDFFDYGKYLRRHAKHRVKYYKNENFRVIMLKS